MSDERPIDPHSDDRVTKETTTVNGTVYNYLLAKPDGPDGWIGTVFLIHGWPDLAIGWRFQIPVFLRLRFRVVVPNMCGYAGSGPEKPAGSADTGSSNKDGQYQPPTDEELAPFSFKSAADDIAALAEHLGVSRIVLGGHDWGAVVAYRTAEHHPSLVSHLFTVCVPYFPPVNEFVPLEETVKAGGKAGMAQLGYRLHLRGPDVESFLKSRSRIRSFFAGMYGGRTDDGESVFDMYTGIRLDLLDRIGKPMLMDSKMLDYYTDQYYTHGLRGPLNWYRTNSINFENDKDLAWPGPLNEIPVLFVQATEDKIFTDDMVKMMTAILPTAEQAQVAASHWATTQCPDEVNQILADWVRRRVLPDLAAGQTRL